MRARVQRGYDDLQTRLLAERIARQKDTDAQRRHEARLVRVGELV